MSDWPVHRVTLWFFSMGLALAVSAFTIGPFSPPSCGGLLALSVVSQAIGLFMLFTDIHYARIASCTGPEDSL